MQSRIRIRYAKKGNIGNNDVSCLICRLDSRGFAPQVAIIIMQKGRTASRRVCCNDGVGRGSQLNGSLHGLSIHSRTLSGLAISRENRFHFGSCRASRVTSVSRFSGADNERDQNTLSDLFSANVFTNRFFMQIPISRGELMSANKLR